MGCDRWYAGRNQSRVDNSAGGGVVVSEDLAVVVSSREISNPVRPRVDWGPREVGVSKRVTIIGNSTVGIEPRRSVGVSKAEPIVRSIARRNRGRGSRGRCSGRAGRGSGGCRGGPWEALRVPCDHAFSCFQFRPEGDLH